MIVGLAIGNLLATLSWRYAVAPIAVEKRLTAYYAMERVVGRRLVLVYDAVSCILLAGLAGAMFTVSATAFAAIFNVDAPELSDMYPTNASFVVIVINETVCSSATSTHLNGLLVKACSCSDATAVVDVLSNLVVLSNIYLMRGLASLSLLSLVFLFSYVIVPIESVPTWTRFHVVTPLRFV